MGSKKKQLKIKAALQARIDATPNLPGFKTQGSMNRKKSGYVKVAAMKKSSK
jgi:hypothetical protein